MSTTDSQATAGHYRINESTMTISKAVSDFLSHYEMTGRGRTCVRVYSPCLDKFMLHCGIRDVSEIRIPETTDRVCSELMRSGLDSNTVWYAMTVIRVFLRFHDIPVRNVFVPRRERRRRRSVTADEHAATLSLIPQDDFCGIRDTALLMVLADTGMRVSEVAGIRMSDIDWERGVVRLRTAKTRAQDIACWSDGTSEHLLRRYLPLRENLPCGCEYLFTARENRNGSYRDGITPRTVQRIVRQRFEDAGLKGITPHKYRHGKAYAIHEKGGTLADIRNILRHSSLESSLSYLNMFEREDADRMRKFLR